MIRSMPKKGAFVIFGEDGKADDDTFGILIAELLRLKDQGASKDKIISVIEEVYHND